jgi:hypothetical protein
VDLKVSSFDRAIAVDWVVNVLDGTLIRLLRLVLLLLQRCSLGVGVGSVMIEVLIRVVPDHGGGLLAATRVELRVVKLEGGCGGAPH